MKELLTGKCKEDFEKWFRPNVTLVDINIFNHRTTPFSMQYGVYLEFFDSVGIDIKCDYWINFNHIDNDKRYYRSWVNDDKASQQFTETRQEAQQQAIIKANTIYNERH